jgi:hypothetical protein
VAEIDERRGNAAGIVVSSNLRPPDNPALPLTSLFQNFFV